MGAELYVMATDVDGVYLGWGTPRQRRLGWVTPGKLAERLAETGQFPQPPQQVRARSGRAPVLRS